MKSVTLFLALLCVSCDRLPQAPAVPAQGPARSSQARYYDVTHLIRHVDVRVRGEELVATLVSTLAMDSLGSGFDVQVMMDTDQDPETHPAGDRVARVLERSGDVFPIRIGLNPDDPRTPGTGGWGAIAGYGTLDDTRHRLTLHIPLAALADDGVLDWEFGVFRGLDYSAARGSTP